MSFSLESLQPQNKHASAASAFLERFAQCLGAVQTRRCDYKFLAIGGNHIFLLISQPFKDLPDVFQIQTCAKLPTTEIFQTAPMEPPAKLLHGVWKAMLAIQRDTLLFQHHLRSVLDIIVGIFWKHLVDTQAKS